MSDDTEELRRAMIATGQVEHDLEHAEQMWTTDELARDYDVIGFLAPFVVVKRKADGVKGSMEFKHSPRVYFNFVADGG